MTLRRVFDPFQIQLRISQPAGNASTASPDSSPAAKAASKAAAKGKSQQAQGQEIRLVVPEIGVVMNAGEFEVLTDVISNVGMAQVCTCGVCDKSDISSISQSLVHYFFPQTMYARMLQPEMMACNTAKCVRMEALPIHLAQHLRPHAH